jgi:hypothetical protein
VTLGLAADRNIGRNIGGLGLDRNIGRNIGGLGLDRNIGRNIGVLVWIVILGVTLGSWSGS